MKKRMVSLLLACCLVLALLPTMASALDMNAVPTLLYVGDTNVIGGGYWKTTADGGLTKDGASESDYNVAYTAGTRILTLKDANIEKYTWSRYGVVGYINQAGIWAGIHTDGSLVIDLIGENTIDLTGAGTLDADCAAIALGQEYQWLTFRGDGNLTATSGKTSGNSFGVLATASVTMSGTGTVTLLGGECGYNKVSAGIYDQGTLDDNDAVIAPRTGKLIAGTDFGGASSFGVYGKMLLSEWNYNVKGAEFEGNFTAYCGKADLAVALSLPPLYSPVGNSALMGSEDRKGDGYVVYDAIDNGLYTYVNVEHNLKTGASIDASSFVEASKTPYTITVTAASILGGNPGNQTVEYALGSYNAYLPSIGWQKETLFTGLTPRKTYMVYARTAATTEYAAGPAKAVAIATPVDAVTADNDVSVYTGLSVDGIAIDKSENLVHKQVGDDAGWMSYDSATRTLTLGGTVTITHGCQTIGYGEAVGIFSNAELHIVLADGAVVNINMKNYARDRDLVRDLETSTPLTGRCYGILNEGDLTIDAAEGCKVTPQLNINVVGAATAFGIYAKEVRDASSAVLEDGDVTIGAVDTNITVRGMTGPVTINPSLLAQQANGYPNVTGISSGDDITFNGVTGVDTDSSTQYHVQTVGGYSGHLFTAGATGYGVVQMNGGYVYAENNGRNGNYRISYNTIKWALGYTCTDSEGNRVEMKDAYWVNGSAAFDPNGEPVLKGELVISGKAEQYETLTATIVDGNLGDNVPTYQWYRYPGYGEATAIKKANASTYELVADDVNKQIFCEVTCPTYAGKLVSAKTEKIKGVTFPEIYICGTQITNKNMEDVLGDGTVSYDLDTNVLTLKNANLTKLSEIVDSNGDVLRTVIWARDSLNTSLLIDLVGDSTISTSVENAMAIYSRTLTFTGSGSLTAHADYPREATIYASNQINIGDNCKITTSCKEHKSNTLTSSPSGALFAGDMYVTDNASLYAFIDDGEGDDRNAKACAAQVYYVATIRDNAQVRVDGSRHEGLIVGYLQMEGGYLRVDNIGSQYRTAKNYVEKTQYAALKVTDLYLGGYGIKNIPGKLTISNAKVEIYSEFGYGIQEQDTENHYEKVDGTWQKVHTELADNFEISNSTVIVRIGAKAASIAPIKMEDTDGGTIIADDCTVYAGTDETGADATLSTKDAFLTKGSRYVRLIAGSAVDVGTKVTESEAETTVTADIAAGPKSEKEASVLIVRFNAAGRFAGLKYQTAVLSGKTWTIEASFANPQPGDTYKVYVLDGTRYVPMRNAALVHLKNS